MRRNFESTACSPWSARCAGGVLAPLVTVLAIVFSAEAQAAQETLSDGLDGDGHMTIRSDQYGAFGSFSIYAPGFGQFAPDSGEGLKDWQYVGALMLADDSVYRWLMDRQDWSGEFVNLMDDGDVLADISDGQRRASSFAVPDFGDLQIDLVQYVPITGYNYVQRYTFNNQGDAELSLKAVWFNDQDLEFAQTHRDNRFGFVAGDLPRAYFIEDSDVAGEGDPGVDDRDRRISIIAAMGEGVSFDGYLGAGRPAGEGGATRLQNYLRTHRGIFEGDYNIIDEIDDWLGAPTSVDLDQNDDGLMDEGRDTSATMQFSLRIPAGGRATLGFNYVGGSLSNAVFLAPDAAGDLNGDGVLDAADIDELTSQSAWALHDVAFDLNNDFLVNEADVWVWIRDSFKSWIGDADLDGRFDSGDLVIVLASGSYEADVASNWSTGDFNGDGRTNSSDLVAALADGGYELGPRAAARAVPEPTGAWRLVALLWCAAPRRRP